MNPLLERMTIDPQACGGKPRIKCTRIWVSLVLDLLSEGMTEAELLAGYPQLAHEDVLATIAFGAELHEGASCGFRSPDRPHQIVSASSSSARFLRNGDISPSSSPAAST